MLKLSSNIYKYAKRLKSSENWCLAASEHNNIGTIGSIALGEENDLQDEVYIYEYDSNTWHQNWLFELSGIRNVILKETQKCIQLVNYKENVDPANYYLQYLLFYKPWQKVCTDLLQGQTSYANAFKVHIKTVQQKLQQYEP